MVQRIRSPTSRAHLSVFSMVPLLLRLLLLPLLSVSTATAIANPLDSDGVPPVQCFRTQTLALPLRCIRSEDKPSKAFRNVQIIGSFKTGTSAMYGLIKHSYPNVVEAVAEMQGKFTGPEIKFINSDIDIAGGYKRYEGFFNVSLDTAPDRQTILLEKTPDYAFDTLAPFRAAAMLPATTKYIYTIRNSTEADMSLFMFRGLSRFKVDYNEYVDIMVHSLEQWMDCRNRTFPQLFVSASGSAPHASQRYDVDSLFDKRIFSPDVTRQVEDALFSVCSDTFVPRNKFPWSLGVHVYQAYLHAMNLRRWVHAVGEENIMCVQNDDIVSQPNEVNTVVGRFLGLPRSGHVIEAPTHTGASQWDVGFGLAHTPHTWDGVVERLRADMRQLGIRIAGNDLMYEKDIDSSAQKVTAVFERYTSSEDRQWLGRICPPVETLLQRHAQDFEQ
mmetsp:Transcript_13412/g.29394  ORF Transcript_13412/g.29394 Transcript_13412/m.29394 type:complete len:444 (-) Transcript_13412:294-1625(-)